MARRTIRVIDVVELLQHWHAGRRLGELSLSLGVDPKTIRKYTAPAQTAPYGQPLRDSRLLRRGTHGRVSCTTCQFGFSQRGPIRTPPPGAWQRPDPARHLRSTGRRCGGPGRAFRGLRRVRGRAPLWVLDLPADRGHLVVSQGPLAAPVGAAGFGQLDAFALTFADQGALELGEGAHHR